MENITGLFRKVTPEEIALRSQIKDLQKEVTSLRKELKAKKKYWLHRKQQQNSGDLESGEIRITEEWISQKTATYRMAITVKEQKIIQMNDQIQKAAAAMSRQMSLL